MSTSLSSHFIILLTYPLDTLDIQLESLSESFLCPSVVKTRYCWGSLECPLPILRWLRSLAGDVTPYPLEYFCSVFCYNKLMLLLHFWLMLNVFLIDTLFTQTKYFTCMFVRSCYLAIWCHCYKICFYIFLNCCLFIFSPILIWPKQSTCTCMLWWSNPNIRCIKFIFWNSILNWYLHVDVLYKF